MEKREKELWNQPRRSTIRIVRVLEKKNSKIKEMLQENSPELIEKAH